MRMDETICTSHLRFNANLHLRLERGYSLGGVSVSYSHVCQVGATVSTLGYLLLCSSRLSSAD